MTKSLKYIIYITLSIICAIIIAVSGTVLYITPKLPPVDRLTDIKLQIPLRIYTNNGLLISEFGDKKRTPITIDEIPSQLKHAFLSAEDAEFYEHNGISIKGVSRALLQAITQSQTQTGGSTITQQVAKNYFLTPERTIIRKLREMLLAVQMEKSLSKDKILELYLNKIFLGNRAYGVAAAAQVYYGKPLNELTLEQNAMIAGLPKAPSSSNPLRNPERALDRRNWILLRMNKLGYISDEELQTASAKPVSAKKHGVEIEAYAPYVAEMARQQATKILGASAISDGYSIYTTIDPNLQKVADDTLKKGLETYDLRHGYRSAEAHLDNLTSDSKSDLFARIPKIGKLERGIVTKINDQSIIVEFVDQSTHQIEWENGLSNARPYISENQRGPAPKTASDIVKIGDLVRVKYYDKQWHLAQLPAAEGALVSIDSYNGAIRALSGGYDFQKSEFNRVIQAKRQMGSSMKPFIYSAAISQKMNAASIINDAPIVFHDNQLENAWRPTNDGGRFLGPTRLRVGLYRSRNLVSIRILKQIGINYARDYITRFGFEKAALPKDLSLVLGSASFTPLEAARGYAVFANQGYLIEPYLIQRIVDGEDNVVYEAHPAIACDNCLENSKTENIATNIMGNIATNNIIQSPQSDSHTNNQAPRYANRVMTKQDAFIMDSMLRDVTKKGTGWRAGKAVQRTDIGGKTGTSNGPTDLWFSGYHPDLVTIAWVGFDNNTNLGNREYGGTAALPIWTDFMKEALKDLTYSPLKTPEGVVSVLINTKSGKRARPGQSSTMFEYFKEGNVPALEPQNNTETNLDIEDIFYQESTEKKPKVNNNADIQDIF